MVQLCVSQLRKALAGRRRRGDRHARPRLRAAARADGLDARRFERLIAAGRPREALRAVARRAARRCRRRAVRGRRDPAPRGAAPDARWSWPSTQDLAAGRHRRSSASSRRWSRERAVARALPRAADAGPVPLRPAGGRARRVPRRHGARWSTRSGSSRAGARDLQEAILRQDPALDLARPGARARRPSWPSPIPLLGGDDELVGSGGVARGPGRRREPGAGLRDAGIGRRGSRPSWRMSCRATESTSSRRGRERVQERRR